MAEKKYKNFLVRVDERDRIKLPKVYRDAWSAATGIEDFKGCILELKISVIYNKDNEKFDL
jgi:hypothetical protein